LHVSLIDLVRTSVYKVPALLIVLSMKTTCCRCQWVETVYWFCIFTNLFEVFMSSLTYW